MNDTITAALLDKYFAITEEALAIAKQAPQKRKEEATICIDMAERYVSDAHHFRKEGDLVLSYGALNYAHGWLDCGARLGFFSVDDDRLFTVDKK